MKYWLALSVLLLVGLSVICGRHNNVSTRNLYLVNIMSQSELLNETLSLLKEMKLEHGNTDNGISRSLEQAISNLENVQGYDDSKIPEAVLKILGKLLKNFPEIQELINYLSNL